MRASFLLVPLAGDHSVICAKVEFTPIAPTKLQNTILMLKCIVIYK